MTIIAPIAPPNTIGSTGNPEAIATISSYHSLGAVRGGGGGGGGGARGSGLTAAVCAGSGFSPAC